MSDPSTVNSNPSGVSGLEEETSFDQVNPAVVHENTVGKLFHTVDSLVETVSNSLEVEKSQAYLFCVFVALLIVVYFCIYIAWNYYSPIIARFFEKEERLKRASEKEKRKDE